MNTLTELDHVLPEREALRPLCVDLDETFIQVDSLYELILKYLIINPFNVFRLLNWLLKGKEILKLELANRIDLTFLDHVPVNPHVKYIINHYKKNGLPVYLVTAASSKVAEKLTKRYSFFDGCYASTESINLKGKNKAAVLKEKFGESNFDYIGDSKTDYNVFRFSKNSFKIGKKEKHFLEKEIHFIKNEISNKKVHSFIKLLRPHQWAKNLLVFVPLISSHNYTNLSLIGFSLLAFISVCFTASATYIVNDLKDIDADRLHQKKKHRPLAQGTVNIPLAAAAALILFSIGVATSFFVSIPFMFGLMVYLFTTLLYTFLIKKMLILDVVTLAGLYLWRIYLGTLAIAVTISDWLLAFAMFFFFSLALAKRYIEITRYTNIGNEKIAGRGYTTQDTQSTYSLGSISGLISVMIFALYINDEKTMTLYSEPKLLWIACVALLFWQTRLWVLVNRGEIPHDPVSWAIKDKLNYLLILVVLIGIAAAH